MHCLTFNSRVNSSRRSLFHYQASHVTRPFTRSCPPLNLPVPLIHYITSSQCPLSFRFQTNTYLRLYMVDVIMCMECVYVFGVCWALYAERFYILASKYHVVHYTAIVSLFLRYVLIFGLKFYLFVCVLLTLVFLEKGKLQFCWYCYPLVICIFGV